MCVFAANRHAYILYRFRFRFRYRFRYNVTLQALVYLLESSKKIVWTVKQKPNTRTHTQICNFLVNKKIEKYDLYFETAFKVNIKIKINKTP